METTLATILVTVAVTAAVIGLGVLVWAIAQLKRKVSRLEVLCSGYESQFQGVYNEFDNRSRRHDDDLKTIRTEYSIALEQVWRRFDDLERNNSQELQEVFRRIDSEREVLERNLDRRFDSVYRKMHSTKITPETDVQVN